MYAGGKFANNTSYYLYNGQHYWTMSPDRWGSSSYALVSVVAPSGYLGNGSVNSATPGVRPVINLRSDVVLTGNGTLDSPFVVEGAE